MKKMLRYLLLTVMTLCFSLPCLGAAEAASVALLPLINNVEGSDVSSQVFYKEALNSFKAKKGFVVMENDRLTQAIEANTAAGKLPTAAQLQKIAEEGNVDIVICMELNVLDDTVLYSSNENTLKLDLQGNAVAYNKITGKYTEREIYSDKQVPEATTTRWDWKNEEWGRQVRISIDRILKAK